MFQQIWEIPLRIKWKTRWWLLHLRFCLLSFNIDEKDETALFSVLPVELDLHKLKFGSEKLSAWLLQLHDDIILKLKLETAWPFFFLKIFSYPVLSKTSSLSLNDNTCRTSRNFTELTINYSSTPRFFSIYHCFKKALSDFFNLFDDFLLMISFPDIISSIICFFLSVSDNDWSNIDSLSGRKNSPSGWSITITFRAVGSFLWWW